jgi:hypothetical protein
MVTDEQVQLVVRLVQMGERVSTAAAKAGMDPKTARKYLRLGKLPSQCKRVQTWSTRKDPFEDFEEEIREQLEIDCKLKATQIFEALRRKYPGRFRDGQIRTLQRKLKAWRRC